MIGLTGVATQAPWITVASVVCAVGIGVAWTAFGLPGRIPRQFKSSKVPEVGMNYSAASVQRFLSWIGKDGITMYRQELGWDMVFALAFGAALSLSLRGLLLPHLPDGSRWRMLMWLPFLYAALDVVEDLLLLHAVRVPPPDDGPIPGVAARSIALARWATRGKFLSVGVSGALILAGGAVQASSVPTQPSVIREAVFDYSMPPRFGFDANHDGLTDVMSPEQIQQRSFTVTLDACATEGSVASYNWTIEGTPEGTLTEHSSDCHLSHDLPEGTYPVTLSVRWRDGVVRIADHPVMVRDWLVVSAGDSFASGQGAPQRSTGPIPHWQESSCFRSAAAGATQAALALEREDPRTSVTFLHVACSGATILDGLLGPQEPDAAGAIGESQLDVIRDDVGDRPIDALVVSIGGNDIGFANIIARCLTPFRPCGHTKQTEEIAGQIDALTRVGGGIDTLAACISAAPACPVDAAKLSEAPRHIFVTAYPDMTQRLKNGNLRDCRYATFRTDEFRWARVSVLEPLNARLREAWERSGAVFLAHPRQLWQNHGVCSSDRWFTGPFSSLAREGKLEGAFHPNAKGYALGYEPVILAGLYEDGIGPAVTVDG